MRSFRPSSAERPYWCRPFGDLKQSTPLWWPNGGRRSHRRRAPSFYRTCRSSPSPLILTDSTTFSVLFLTTPGCISAALTTLHTWNLRSVAAFLWQRRTSLSEKRPRNLAWRFFSPDLREFDRRAILPIPVRRYSEIELPTRRARMVTGH